MKHILRFVNLFLINNVIIFSPFFNSYLLTNSLFLPFIFNSILSLLLLTNLSPKILHIELIINNKKNKLVEEYELKEGENVIILLIKNKLTFLSTMFYNCKNLKDINELKYLNVNEITDFSNMFLGC